MKKMRKYLQLLIVIFFISSFVIQSAAKSDKIIMDYFWNPGCGTCQKKAEVIDSVLDNLGNDSKLISYTQKDVRESEFEDEYNAYHEKYDVSWPFIVLRNHTTETIIPSGDIDFDYVNKTINDYIQGWKTEQYNADIVKFEFLIWNVSFNMTDFSLPVLTIILGGLDSFNPCAFFILFFLMNLLIHMQSRKRMLLIGSIFIFFSGLFYFIFMFVMLNAFILADAQIAFLTIIVGGLAVALGLLNVKDFFFFKKGITLSIPESKKTDIYKKMRSLVKTSYLPAVVGSTIVLAISVNFYELICSAILPAAYIRALTLHELSDVVYYQYIFFYNVVYVIPLVIIVLAFIFTLGRRQLSEWHGRILKLLSGIMIFSFGILLLIDYTILENIFTPILLLVSSIISTILISYIWKNFFEEKESKKEDETS